MIGEEGEQLGVMDVRDAIRAAREKGLDLVEVAPNCRSASLPDHRFRKVSVRSEEEGERGEEEAGNDHGQGS